MIINFPGAQADYKIPYMALPFYQIVSLYAFFKLPAILLFLDVPRDVLFAYALPYLQSF